MKPCAPVWAPMCIVLLGLFGSAARAQCPLTAETREQRRPTVLSGIATTVQSFDGLDSTGQAQDSLPQSLAAAALEAAGEQQNEQDQHDYADEARGPVPVGVIAPGGQPPDEEQD